MTIFTYTRFDQESYEQVKDLAHWFARQEIQHAFQEGKGSHVLNYRVRDLLDRIGTVLGNILGEHLGLIGFKQKSDEECFRSTFTSAYVEMFYSLIESRSDLWDIAVAQQQTAEDQVQNGKKEKETKGFRRFFLHSDEEEKKWSGVLYPNGCMALNVHPGAFPTHFCSYEEFDKAHGRNRIEWIDPA